MNHEQQEVGGLIRSGKYFEEARDWYSALYIGPISERGFFLVILGLAGFVALVSMAALLRFMPVTERPPIILNAADIDNHAPSLKRMRARTAPIEAEVAKFMIAEYVQRRESYSQDDFATNFAFVRAQSDAPTATAYLAVYAPSNPRSPVSILGANGRRIVQISSVSMGVAAEPAEAVVKFSTELEGVGTTAKTQWTATLSYYYSPPKAIESEDPSAEVQVEDPQFKVVKYAVVQMP